MEPPLPFDSLRQCLGEHGQQAALQAVLGLLQNRRDYHGLYRILLLQKRLELGLPELNPGELSIASPQQREAYQLYADQLCREIGERYLVDGRLKDAWRHFRAIGDYEPLRRAFDRLPAEQATPDLLAIALDEGVHPVRGLELLVERNELGNAIASIPKLLSVQERILAAKILVRASYAELCRAIGAEPADPSDLVKVLRERPELLGTTTLPLDAARLNAVAHLAVLCESGADQVLGRQICEFGARLGPRWQLPGPPPLENGFVDAGQYLKALLGESRETALRYFKAKIVGDDGHLRERAPAELYVSLLWRCGRQSEALSAWREFFVKVRPDRPGLWLRSFYDLCQQAGDYAALAEMARQRNDLSAWLSAEILQKRETNPGPNAPVRTSLEPS